MHSRYIPEVQIFVCFILQWAGFELCRSLGKVHRITPNDRARFKVTTTDMHTTFTPKAKIFSRFILLWAVFELWLNIKKSALNDPKVILAGSRSKVPICIVYFCKQIFVCFTPRWAVFKLHPFSKKSALNDLAVFKVKMPIHMLHTPLRSRFSSISFYNELMTQFCESAPNEWPKKWRWYVQGEKYPYAYNIHPRGPNFLPFRSTMNRFPVTALFFGKLHRMTPNNHDIFKVKSTHMHTYIPEAQIFIRFTLPWAVFEEVHILNSPLVTM